MINALLRSGNLKDAASPAFEVTVDLDIRT